MMIIKKLANEIKEEMAGAEKYIKMSIDYPESAPTFVNLAEQELAHAMKLHEEVVKYIKAERAKGVEIPKFMELMWADEHKELIKKHAETKNMIETVRKSIQQSNGGMM